MGFENYLLMGAAEPLLTLHENFSCKLCFFAWNDSLNLLTCGLFFLIYIKSLIYSLIDYFNCPFYVGGYSGKTGNGRET